MKNKDTYLISKAFKNFIVASILSTVSVQLAQLFDGIIVSNFVHIQGLSALNMAEPLSSLMFGFILFICMGASILVAKKIGLQQNDQANRIFSVAMFSGFIFFIVLTIVLLLYLSEVSELLCPEEDILIYLKPYLSIFIPGMIVSFVSTSLYYFIGVDGNTKLLITSFIIFFIVNVVLDLVFVPWFGWGMKGVALSNLISRAFSVLILMRHFRTGVNTLRFVNPLVNFAKNLKNNLAHGVPLLADAINNFLVFFLLNRIVLKTLHVEGAYILSICMQIYMFSFVAIKGAGETILAIGGNLIGENDTLRLPMLIKKSILFVETGIGALTALVLIFPEKIISLFGSNDPLIMESGSISLRIFVISIIFLSNSMILNYIYQLLGRFKISSVFMLMQMLILIPVIWTISKFSPEYLWIGFPVTYILILCIQLIYSRIVSAKHPGMDTITLLPAIEKNSNYDKSVNYTKEDVISALNSVRNFIEAQNISRSVSDNIILCAEELMLNQLEYGKNKKADRSFDIHITCTDHKLSVSIKDDGKPFDPRIKFQDLGNESLNDEDLNKIGLTIVNEICKDINYKYMYGQNMVYMRFDR